MREKVTEKQTLLDYFAEQSAREAESNEIYNYLHIHFKGKVDAVYESTIIGLVGQHGLALLREFHLIEACGRILGRKLYAI